MPATVPPEEPERRIPDPGFAGDDGSADPAVAAALAAYASDRSRYADALAAVLGSRVLVPVVALLGEVETGDDGLAREKDSDMATVLLTGRDGRTGLLAFTSLDALRAWDPQARPVPVPARTAAASAVQEGADALLLDLAGPAMLTVQGDDLRRAAAGWTLARAGADVVWIRPAPE